MVLWLIVSYPGQHKPTTDAQRVWEMGRESWNWEGESGSDMGSLRDPSTLLTLDFRGCPLVFWWPQQSHGAWNLQRPQTWGFFCRTHSAKRLKDYELVLVRPPNLCFFGPFCGIHVNEVHVFPPFLGQVAPLLLSGCLCFEISTVHIPNELLIIALQESMLMPG